MKCPIIFFCAALLLITVTGCSNDDTTQNTSSTAPGTEIETTETGETSTSEPSRAKTWQEACLHEDVIDAIWPIYRDDGTSGTLKRYYEELSANFAEGENLYADKFYSYYNQLDYDSMDQLEKDVIEGLLFCFGEGDWGYIDLDVPFEKAWMVGEGENNTNAQKHRKIVLKLTVPHTDSIGVEMDFWISDFRGSEYEEHSANIYLFGEENNPNYDARKGINDVTKDSGIWANALRDYYNNEAYVSLDVDRINTIVQENKEFLAFMKEYMDIHTDYQLELWEAERAKEEAKKSIEPAVGMTKDAVLEGAWGSPEKKNITETAAGISEQWVYGNGRYIYFENGIVTAIQRTE